MAQDRNRHHVHHLETRGKRCSIPLSPLGFACVIPFLYSSSQLPLIRGPAALSIHLGLQEENKALHYEQILPFEALLPVLSPKAAAEVEERPEVVSDLVSLLEIASAPRGYGDASPAAWLRAATYLEVRSEVGSGDMSC